ncbi:MAG: hypothetical protein ACK5LF_25580 [Bacteroides xylanisolvens]
MADILTRLLLDTKGFDANLTKSKQGVNNYQSSITEMAKNAGAGILKFAGAIGVAVGGMEAFGKTINSTQTTGDAYVRVTDQMKASVDSFFASIAMGDFSGFINNLQNVIGKAGTLADALDELATKSLFSDAEINNLTTQKNIQANIARDRSRSDKERNDALAKARDYQLKITNLQKSLAGTNKQTAYSTLDTAIAKQGFKGNVARSTWDWMLKESNRSKWIAGSSEYKTRKQRAASLMDVDPESGLLIHSKASLKAKREFDAWAKTQDGRNKEFMYYFSEMDDSEESMLNKAMQLNAKANSMFSAISDDTLQLNMADAKINGSYKTKSGASNKTAQNAKESPAGSLNEISKELAEAREKYNKAATDELRQQLFKVIEELEAKQINLNFRAEFGKRDMPELKQAGLGNNIKSSSKKITKLEKIKPSITKEDINANKEYGESLSAIGNIMGNVSGAFDSNTASILQWGASLFSTIGQAIPAIAALIGIKTSDTATTNANTTAELENAGAKVISAHAGIPFVGVALGVAGIAAIVAAMASIPKFANGGIVPGGSFSGDKVPALLNSGEMILNGSQQANLFKQLNSGAIQRIQVGTLSNSLRESISPDESSRSIDVSGDWKIRTSDLYLVLKNYMNKTGKKL